MITVPGPFTLSVVCMTTDAVPSSALGQAQKPFGLCIEGRSQTDAGVGRRGMRRRLPGMDPTQAAACREIAGPKHWRMSGAHHGGLKPISARLSASFK